MRPSISRGSLLLLAAAQLINAHTWIEQLMVIAPNGTMAGEPGYPRGNVLRTKPGFGDPLMVNLIPPGSGRPANQILPTDLMCKSTQTSQVQTDGSPRLQAAPGSAIALRFQENGHVTLPDNQAGKPRNRGTVYVYGTSQPSPDDSFLAIHRQWTADGKGGDGRGALLSTQNFDDGQCYQVNGGQISTQRQQKFPHTFDQLQGNNLWCQQDIALPANLQSGQPYTLYWVWDWPTMPGTAGFPEGKQEIYTTCMDVDIVDSSLVTPISKASVKFDASQAIANAGISAQLADINNPTAVTGDSIDFGASATGPALGQAATESASPSITDDGFLSVHTTSTGGPGLSTGTSIIPIGASSPTTVPAGFTQPTAASQPTSSPSQTSDGGQGGQQGGRGGGGGGGGGGRGNGNGSGQFGDGTATAIQNGVPMSTFTQYDTATETVFQTIYNTQFTKRTITESPTATVVVAPRAEPTCSRQHKVFRLRARMPFVRSFLADNSDC